ncbi:Pkinase-domain-containing protein, partial [Exidia glandulosa HHB12029]
TWNVRPPAQEVYEHLEDFFPEHDLDKPLLESATGGGDSPATPVSATAAQPSPLTRGGAGMKHRRTIRHVAREGKKILDRTSKIESPQAAMLRKRSTKLWGTKVEEVTPGAGRSGPPSAVPESPNSTTAKPVTRWIKGDLIGKGTYGKVFLALNANTGEMIAVKQVELPKTVSDKADARQTIVVDAIKSESTTLRDLDHPNVVQYLGFEETTDYFNLFLEYVPGGSIGGILRKHGKFDEEVAKCFTLQMLSGLEYLHSRGIWHRDLKGDNILVDPSGVCKISDFGISKRTEDVERFDPSATNMQGSIFWMAPEVLSNAGMGYNAKIDIWSLGCVYVEMMTGRRPWENENFVAVMYKLSTTKEAPPIPQLSDIGQEFVSMCFEKDPNMRPTAAVLRKHAYLSPRPGWVFQPGSFRAD